MIIDACRRERRPLPAAIQNAPMLHQGLELFYTAFLDLSADRHLGGFSEGPIPWSSVERYCDAHGIWGEQREDMHWHLRKMDELYLDYRGKKIRAESGTKQTVGKKGNG